MRRHCHQAGLRREHKNDARGILLQPVQHIEQHHLNGRCQPIDMVQIDQSIQTLGVRICDDPLLGIAHLECCAGQRTALMQIAGERLFARSGFSLDSSDSEMPGNSLNSQQQVPPTEA